MIETVDQLIGELEKYRGKKVFARKWVECWSGHPEDTNMSEYVKAPIECVEERKEGIVIIAEEY